MQRCLEASRASRNRAWRTLNKAGHWRRRKAKALFKLLFKLGRQPMSRRAVASGAWMRGGSVLEPSCERQDDQDEQDQSRRAAAHDWASGIEPSPAEQHQQNDQDHQ
jgi:hypothetical protein